MPSVKVITNFFLLGFLHERTRKTPQHAQTKQHHSIPPPTDHTDVTTTDELRRRRTTDD
jgi:hypothetical protein